MQTPPAPGQQEPTHRRIMGLAESFENGSGPKIRLTVFPRAEEGLGAVEKNDVKPEELPGVDLQHTDAILLLDVIIDPARHEIIKIVKIHNTKPRSTL